MRKKEEILKEFDRQFGGGPSLPRMFLERLLNIEETLDSIRKKLGE